MQDRDYSLKTLGVFWQHAKKYWPKISICALGVLVLIGADLVSPLLYKKLFDLLSLDPFHRTQKGSLDEIDHTIIAIGIAATVSWMGYRLCMWALTRFESKTMADLTNTCFKYMHGHSVRFFSDSFTGSLTKRINRFAAGFEVIADQCLLQLGQTLIRLALIIGILFWRNKTLGWVFLAWTLIFVACNFFFARYKLKYDMERAKVDTLVAARVADTINNNINLKLFAATDREVNEFEKLTEQHRKARMLSWDTGERWERIQGISVRALEITVLIISVRFWWRGILTLGDFLLLRSYLLELSGRVREVGQSVRKIYESMADANEMTQILLSPHEVMDAPDATELVVSKGEIEFRNASFAYAGGGELVLKNFSLKTKKGEKIGVVGSSGGGKSTLLKLLTRLYDLQSGEVLVDGQNISLVTQNSLHRSIAFVPQEPILFHRSLMENIRYSRPEATDQEVFAAAAQAHCHEFISRFPNGYETTVGERGIKLSGGEKQRVAIARAILMDAPILLLDEATSSLDSESEMYIQDALSKLVKGRTVIAVAHRLSTIRQMDRILVVKDGQIIEEGHHDLLLEIENGLYQRLWNLQSLGIAPAPAFAT